MRTDSILTKEYLSSLFEYRDGDIFWKVKRSHHTKMGRPAGSLLNSGYLGTRVDNVLYKNHVLIWIIHYGAVPDGKKVIHKNSIRKDSRIENLIVE